MMDANAWSGTWPFGVTPTQPLLLLVSRLRAAGLRGAVVSPLDAIFAPSPDDANMALRDAIAAQETFDLRFAPVIDPTQANWQLHLARLRPGGLVVAIRLLPGYHGYGLDLPALDALAGVGLPVIVQVRMLDERAHHPLVQVPPVPMTDLVAFAVRWPAVPVIASGIFWSEVPAIANVPNIHVELSSIESDDTLPNLLSILPADRVLFGTHSPVYDAAPAIAKLAGVGDDVRATVASGAFRHVFATPRRR
jgi:hypothetical protein